MLLKVETVRTIIKIVSIPDDAYFSEVTVGCTLSYFVHKLCDVPVGFVNPPLI